MANDISIKLKLDGERDFNQALKTCNTELKNMKSGVAEVDAANKGAANSEKALADKVNALSKASESAKNKVQTLTQIVDKQKQAQSDAAKALIEAKNKFGENSKEVEKAQAAYNSATNSVNKWETELNKAKIEANNIDKELKDQKGYLDEAKNSTDGLTTSIDEYGKETKDANKETDDLQKTMAKTAYAEEMNKVMSALADTVGKVGEKASESAKELDKGFDTIAKKTGATGKDLKQFKTIAEDIFGDMPTDMEEVGAAVGEVNTRFKQSGEQLKKTSTQFLKFARVNDTDVSDAIDDVQVSMSAFRVETKDVGKVLDAVTRSAQQTGVKTTSLTKNLTANATAFQQLGMDIYSSVDFLGKLEVAGADSSAVLSGLKRALKNATDNGVDFQTALANLEDTITNGTNEMDGLEAAYDLFGRSGANVFQAVKNGQISFKDLAKSTSLADEAAGALDDTYNATLSGWDNMTTAVNKLKTVGSELATEFYDAAAPAVDTVSDALSGALELFRELPEEVQTVIGVIAGVGSIAAQVVPNIINFTTQLATLKVMKKLAGDGDKLTGGLGKLKGAFSGLKGGIGTTTAVLAGVAAGMAAVDQAADQLSKTETRLKQNAETTREGYESTKDSVQDLKETISGYTSTQEKREAIEAKIAEVSETNRQAARQYKESTIDSKKAIDIQTQAMTDEMDIFGELLNGFTNGAVRLKGFTEKVEGNTDAHKAANETIEATEKDLAELNKMLSDVEAEEAAAAAETSAAAQTIINAEGNVIAAKDASISKTGEELTAWKNLDSQTQTVAQNVATACGQMKDAITAGADSIGNFFDAVAEKEKVSAQDMYNNFQSQIEAVKNWEQNLVELADLGINQGLLQYMADMGPQASNYVEAMKKGILDKTGATVDEWNAAYKDKLDLEGAYNEEANNLLTAIGESAAGSKEAFNAMAKDLNAATKENGKFVVAGMVEGIKSAMDQAKNAGEDLGEETVEGAAKGAQTQSPSRFTKEVGANIDQGLILGMNQKKSTVSNTAKQIAVTLLQAIKSQNLQSKAQTEGQKVGTGLVTGINSKKSAATQAATALANAVATAIKGKAGDAKAAGEKLMTSVAAGINSGSASAKATASSVGASIANSLANGISRNAGTARSAAAAMASAAVSATNVGTGTAYSIGWAISAGVAQGIRDGQSQAISAATAMAANALIAAKSALGIHSPSKVFEDEVGKMAAEGFAKGFNQTISLETGPMVKTLSRGLPDMSQYNAQAPQVHVYLGDRELTSVMTTGVVKNITGGVRAYGAVGGRR